VRTQFVGSYAFTGVERRAISRIANEAAATVNRDDWIARRLNRTSAELVAASTDEIVNAALDR
jgi:hypothetical protein